MAKNAAVPEDLHEWISFEDPEEERTWVFDATFLLSSYTCIYGNGCQGVLTGPAEEQQQGCCSYGAHFLNDDDLASVEKYAERLTAKHWQYKREAAKKGGIAHKQDDGSWITHLVKDACIFLNRPGFANGAGCALHQAAVEAGERPLDWKPDVCWQVPIRQSDHTDDHGYVTSTIREWKRRDWGEGGEEFHWWCTDSREAFVGKKPTYITSKDELIELVGLDVYEMLARELDKRRATKTFLPHPALRRR